MSQFSKGPVSLAFDGWVIESAEETQTGVAILEIRRGDERVEIHGTVEGVETVEENHYVVAGRLPADAISARVHARRTRLAVDNGYWLLVKPRKKRVVLVFDTTSGGEQQRWIQRARPKAVPTSYKILAWFERRGIGKIPRKTADF